MDERHTENTGVSNKKIIDNLINADSLGIKTIIRCIIVNGVNTDEVHYRSIAEIAASLKHCEGVEFLSYHAYAGSKATFIGRADNGVKEWIPSAEQIESAKNILISYDINVI